MQLFLANLALLLIVMPSNALSARDYSADALAINGSVDIGNHFTDTSAKNNIALYQGSSAPQSSYYSGGNMEADASGAVAEDSSAQIVNDVLYSSPDYSINANENWLKNAQNITKDPESVVSLITSSYNDCGSSQKSCSYYQQANKEICRASRVLEVDTYHKYQCFKDKYSYEIECENILDLSCVKYKHRLPHITQNNFPILDFTNGQLNVGVGWLGGNCGGYNYELKFNISSPSAVDSFRLKTARFDDKILVYINNKLVYNPVGGGCERGRIWGFSPNLNLRPHLVSGENSIRIKLIVGGRGFLSTLFDLKYRECDSYGSNVWDKTCSDKAFKQDQCLQKENICIEGPEIRDIGQGVSEYKSCWEYSIKETCRPSDYINHCKQLEDSGGCSQVASECIDQGDSQCLNYQNGYKCTGNEISVIEDKVEYEGLFQDIITDYIDYSNCRQFDQSSYCSIIEEVCTDTGRRNVDGLIINKSCWDYDRTYTCSNESPNLSSCSTLEKTCSFDSLECAEKNADDICIEYTRNYQCNNVGGDSADIAICGSQVYCENGDCEDIAYEKDTNFSRAASSLAMLDEAAQDLNNDNSTTFTGAANKCGKDLINYSNCCKISGWGGPLGGSCSTEEKTLKERREEKLCVYVGEYCSLKVGITQECVKEKQAYCCFNSKIARIIHEQGRPQLGIGWGSPKVPNCAGFPITQLDDIDFSAINFSELSADIMRNAQGNMIGASDLESIVSQKIQNHYDQGGQDE